MSYTWTNGELITAEKLNATGNNIIIPVTYDIEKDDQVIPVSYNDVKAMLRSGKRVVIEKHFTQEELALWNTSTGEESDRWEYYTINLIQARDDGQGSVLYQVTDDSRSYSLCSFSPTENLSMNGYIPEGGFPLT